jgi:YVTN family beta-propeller protein
VRIDPATLGVVDRYSVHAQDSVGGLTSLTLKHGVLWGTVQGRLVNIGGAHRGMTVSQLPRPDWGPLTVLKGSIWESQINWLYHLSTTGHIISSLNFPQGALASGDGYVWAANPDANVVAQIDPRTTTIVRTVPVGDGPTGLTFGDGSLWVCSQDGVVTQIDPVAGKPLAAIRVGGSPQGVAFGFGRVWVSVS